MAIRLSSTTRDRILQNISTQSRRFSTRQARSPLIRAEYSTRDNNTGLRALTTATGGTVFGIYQSNSIPKDYPSLVSRGGAIAGFVDQRPA